MGHPMSESRLRVALAALSVAGLAIAGYLTAVHLDGGDPVCLAGGHGCAVVQNSDYADLLGIPVPVIGLFGYLTVLLAAALPGDPGRMLGLFAALIGVGFSGYLTYLELFVIDAICQWCVASAVLMCIVLVLAALRARYVGFDGPSAGREPATS